MPKVIKGFTEETRTISYAEAVEEAGRCYLCANAPCMEASPTRTNIPGFIARIRSRNFRGALRLVKESNFFPGITSRVSPYDEQCEAVCLRARYGGPIRVAELERVLSDYDRKSRNSYQPEIPESIGRNVAIVGSGPTGLAAAVELVLSGCKVIIYESSRVVGGVLTKGVPSYLISDEVIDHEVGNVLNLGVDLVTGINVGESITLQSMKRSFDALLLAIGCGVPIRPEMTGGEKGDIFTGMEIIESLKLKEKRLRLGERVVIVGGGNVSLDAAAALRKIDIPDVTILYRREREQMPAFRQRFEMCRELGVSFRYRTALKEIVSNGQGTISELVCQRTELVGGEDGRVSAVPVEGSEFRLPADTVVFAIGQKLDNRLVELFGLETTAQGLVRVEPETGRTSDPFIFAAGGCVERVDTIDQAIAKGQLAARRIVRELLRKK